MFICVKSSEIWNKTASHIYHMGSVYVWYQISSETKRLAHISQRKSVYICGFKWAFLRINQLHAAQGNVWNVREYGYWWQQQLQRHRKSLFMCLSIELGTNSAATCNTRFYSFSCVAILEGIGWQGSKCVTMKRVHESEGFLNGESNEHWGWRSVTLITTTRKYIHLIIFICRFS